MADSSSVFWGVRWIRDPETDSTNLPVFYQDEQEARAEFDSRDDKYWPSQLVRIDLTPWPLEVVEDGLDNPPAWVVSGE